MCRRDLVLLLMSVNGLEDDFDVEVAGAAGDVKRAEGERFGEGERGGAFEDALADDGILAAEGRGLFGGDAGLLDLGAEVEAVGGLIEGGLDVEADVDVGDLRLGAGGAGGVGAGDERDAAAFAELGLGAGGDDEGEVLEADALAIVHLGDGVGEAVGFVRAVEVSDELAGELEVFGKGAYDDGVARRERSRTLSGGADCVADGGDDVVCLAGLTGVDEVEGGHWVRSRCVRLARPW